MRFIYCADPLQSNQPDEIYAAEAQTADALGLTVSLLNFEALVYEENAQAAIRKIRASGDGPEPAIYRGWMLKPDAYRRLFDALSARGILLINTPEQYTHCHYLPASYDLIADHTPASVWLKLTDAGQIPFEEIMALLIPFGDRPIILKDFVKSRKHEWLEACYIPSASDRSAVERVVTRFLALQGDDLNEGLVFRSFVEFEPLTTHSKSGMPLTKEFRLFFLDGKPVYNFAYWDEGDYQGTTPPLAEFSEIAAKIESRFFTMDVARHLDGAWSIIELGDGQVAGLPDNADIKAFYEGIQRVIG